MAIHGNTDYVWNKRMLGTLTIKDATGTPVAFVVTMYGDFGISDGGYALTRHMDEKGDFVAYPPTRANAQESKWKLKAKQIGAAGQTVAVAVSDDLTIGDFVHQSGEYANLTSTLTGAGTRHEKTFLCTLTLTDGTDITTYTIANGTIGGSWGTGDEANEYDLEITGQQPFSTLAVT